MFILADTEKNSSKSFSSLAELKGWVDGELGNVGLPADAMTSIKNAIELLIPVIKYKQTTTHDVPLKKVEGVHYIDRNKLNEEEEKKLPLEYVEVVRVTKKENGESYHEHYMQDRATLPTPENPKLEVKETKEVKPIIAHLESDEFVKNYMKSNMKPTQLKKQGNFLQSSRWISPEDAGYNPELTKDIETIFTDSRIVVNSHAYEVAADHEGNVEEILDRFKDISKMSKSKITPRIKEFENKLAKWMSENLLKDGCYLNSPFIDGNITWNLLLHSKGDKKILGEVDIPEDILNILNDPELEGYASMYRNTENTAYLTHSNQRLLKSGLFVEFMNLSNYIFSLHIKFQNGRSMDIAYQCYVGMYEDAIRIKHLEDWILAFINMRLKREDKEATVKSSVLYTTFLEWLQKTWCNEICLESLDLRKNIFEKLKTICTQKTFSSILKSVANLTSVRKADGIYWVGVALTDSAGSFAPFEAGETLEGYQSVSFASVLEDTPVVKTEEQKIKETLNDPQKIQARLLMPSESIGIKTSIPGKWSASS